MKKMILLISLFLGIFSGMVAQTTVRVDDVKYFSFTDTLLVSESYSSTTYYVDDFATNVRWQVQGDSLAAGYTKLRCVLFGSLDNVNWFSVGDTISLAANGADSDKALYTNVFYNYLKPVITAVDSTQYSDFNWRLLIDKN